jgi:hypothetical protein
VFGLFVTVKKAVVGYNLWKKAAVVYESCKLWLKTVVNI